MNTFTTTYQGYSYYISESNWVSPGTLTGLIGNSIKVESSGSNFFTTSDETICPITHYSISVSQGNESNLFMGNSSGTLTANAYNQNYEFSITACGS